MVSKNTIMTMVRTRFIKNRTSLNSSRMVLRLFLVSFSSGMGKGSYPTLGFSPLRKGSDLYQAYLIVMGVYCPRRPQINIVAVAMDLNLVSNQAPENLVMPLNR